jgi:cytosine deaminase
MVILQAADPVEAIRLRATRLHVIRRGRVIAETAPEMTRLDLPGRPGEIEIATPWPDGVVPEARGAQS